MRKKRGKIFVVAVLMLGAAGFWFWHRLTAPPDPIYDGHPLSFWVNRSIDGFDGPTGKIIWTTSRRPTIDSNAIPYLLVAARQHPSRIQAWYNNSLWPKLANWSPTIVRHLPTPADPDYARLNAIDLLAELRPHSPSVIETLVFIATHDERDGGYGLAPSAALHALNVKDLADKSALFQLYQSSTNDRVQIMIINILMPRFGEDDAITTLLLQSRDNTNDMRFIYFRGQLWNEALEEKETNIPKRVNAIRGLVELDGSNDATHAFLKYWTENTNPAISAEAARLLKQMSTNAPSK